MLSQRRVPPHQTQPKTFSPTVKSLLSLPFRICNPPAPAVGKVRSCNVTPIFNVKLEDILDRKHLPPLGLKDFEEWLLYVELSPENLYFILWLREYTARYRHWAQRAKLLREEAREYGLDWPSNSSSQLAMFYARAKQTFFTPNSDYELNIPSDMLAPFHVSNSSPHPDPVIFDQVAIETQKMLKESLRRFVSAQFNNVGNNRVICGLIGGVCFNLIGALLPIVYNFVEGHSRWARLSALPGLWLGLSVIIASLHGVCLGVYIFGDLRQLRKFELTRPPISKPQPYYTISSPIAGSPLPSGPMIPMSISTRVLPPPPAHVLMGRPSSHHSMLSSLSRSTSSSDISYSGTDGMIHISPAYYDVDPIEGPAISPVTADTGVFPFPLNQKSQFEDDDDDVDSRPFGATATFIHPFDHLMDDDDDLNDPNKPTVQERQRVSSFDFDALPPLPTARVKPQQQPQPSSHQPSHPLSLNPSTSTTSLQPSILVIQPEAEPEEKDLTPKGFLRRIQSRCNINRWLVMTSSNSSADLNEKLQNDPEKAEYEQSNFPRPHPALQRNQKAGLIKRQFKMVKAVPAFASPLTRVLSPIVIRGQWEIVMRSVIIAGFISWMAIGVLLAFPVPKKH
jgi:hypothetical protein